MLLMLATSNLIEDLILRCALFQPSTLPSSLFPLTPCIHSFIFLAWRPHQNSSTHRLPQYHLKNLCSLVTFVVPSFVFAATNTGFLLNCYLTRIGRIESPLYSACDHPTHDTTNFILYCPATDFLAHRSLATFFLHTIFGSGL